MAQRTGDAKPRDVIVGVHRCLKAYDGVHFQERDRGGRTLVHFEPDLQRGGRIHVLLDDVVQVKRFGPDVLVAESLEAEHLLALRDKGG